MNRAQRRAAQKAARAGRQDGWRCPWCGEQAGTLLELCTEGCCPPRQQCAACGVPVS